MFAAVVLGVFLSVCVYPVSYTHLDVYKRQQIDKTTVGFGGSVTLQELELYDSLAEHNEVHWHWRPEQDKNPIQIRDLAAETEIYLTSANGILSLIHI